MEIRTWHEDNFASAKSNSSSLVSKDSQELRFGVAEPTTITFICAQRIRIAMGLTH
jgi:hypothetical protein